MREDYLLIIILVQITSIILLLKNYRLTNSVTIFLSFILFIFIGFRQIGYDLDTYEMIYNWYVAGLTYRVMEPSVRIIADISNQFRLGYNGFLLIYAFTTFYFLYIIGKKLYKQYDYFFIVYIVLFMASGVMVSIRATVAALAILLALYYFSKKKYLFYTIWLSIAVFFHYSALLILPLSLFLKTKNKMVVILLMVLGFFGIFFLLYIANINAYLFDRLVEYFDRNSFSHFNSALLVQLFRIFIIVASSIFILYDIRYKINVQDSLELIYYNIALFGTVFYFLMVLIGSIDLGKRVYEITAVSIVYLITKYKNKKIIYAVVLIGISNIGYLYMGYLSAVDHYTIHIRDIQP